MRTTLLRHSLSEGFNNLVRHPLVTLASITTIALMLFLLGAFTLFSANARQMMARAGEQPPVEITLEIDVTEDEIAVIEADLAGDPNILAYTLFTPEQNFETFKANLGKDELFSDFSADYIPHTFAIRLHDPAKSEDFKSHMEGLPGVRKVDLELKVMQFLSKAIVWVNYATLTAFAVLGVVAFFIIANMVRVAVFARGDEINIMKYVGATNWYIRIPYILEGAVTGLLGGGLAWLSAYVIYARLYETVAANTLPTDVLAMIVPSELASMVLLLNVGLGIGIGAVGSAVSVRRYIKV
ncbi:MAG: ABC transporter permease [Clostridia bacterium]|nr:ABC transporter permease [Clostridia bacterium]NCC75401.1 ABC transporter permease [Clostridia bacterium]